MNAEQKLQALKSLLDDPDLVDSVLSQAETNEKQADGMGIAFKEAGLDADMHPADLLEFALKNYEDWEAEQEKAEEEEKKKPPFPPKKAAADEEEEEEEEEMPEEEEEKSSSKADPAVAELKAVVTELKGYVTKLSSSRQKESANMATVFEATDAHSTRIKNLEAQVAELSGLLNEATKEIAAFKGEEPRAMNGGYRPSRAEDSVSLSEVAQKAAEEGQTQAGSGGDYDAFLNFIVPENNDDLPMSPAE